MSTIREAQLVLADGTVFEGEAFGAEMQGGVATGEVVFNTALSGYQEIITDPSYAGQMITFTYPHIGNYGVTHLDDESARPHARGVIVRELARRRSNWRSETDLDAYLRSVGVPGIGGIDTRRLTRHIRDSGSMPGAFGTASTSVLLDAARTEPGTSGVDLARQVSCESAFEVQYAGPAERAGRRVVAFDFGIKATILRHLSGIATVEVVPAGTSAADVLARQPDGVLGTRQRSPVCLRPSTRCSARSRSSGSAWDINCWPPRSAPRPTSCPSVTTAAIIRCAGSTPARWRSPVRTTTTPWTTDPSVDRSRSPIEI
jgi:carbamoyl-phosphate synthase small subunit